jgi:hypothetical protein
MADRTSAEIFGSVFDLLAQNPTDEHKELARQIYQLARLYDFSDYQMGADDACLALGVARRGVNPDWPDSGEVTLWPGESGYEEAESVR